MKKNSVVVELHLDQDGKWVMKADWVGTSIRSAHATKYEAAREAAVALRIFAMSKDTDVVERVH